MEHSPYVDPNRFGNFAVPGVRVHAPRTDPV
jgi:hypothetical protein